MEKGSIVEAVCYILLDYFTEQSFGENARIYFSQKKAVQCLTSWFLLKLLWWNHPDLSIIEYEVIKFYVTSAIAPQVHFVLEWQ